MADLAERIMLFTWARFLQNRDFSGLFFLNRNVKPWNFICNLASYDKLSRFKFV